MKGSYANKMDDTFLENKEELAEEVMAEEVTAEDRKLEEIVDVLKNYTTMIASSNFHIHAVIGNPNTGVRLPLQQLANEVKDLCIAKTKKD